jgi:glutaredoxin
MQVVLYTRPGCHLCDVAREVIVAERARRSFEFEEIDISLDDSLELKYGIRIPVVTLEGEERFEIEVDPEEFAAFLNAG